MKNKNYILLIAVNVYWGITTVLMKHALLYMNATTYVGIRMVLGALYSLIIFRKNLVYDNIKTLIYGIILGILLSINIELQVYGLKFTSTTNSVFIAQLTLVVVPLLECIQRRIVPKFHLVITVCLVFFGLIIMLDTDFKGLNLGDAITFVSMIIASTTLFLTHKVINDSNAPSLTSTQLVFAGITSIIITLMFPIEIELHSTSVIILVLTGVIGTGVAYSLQFYALKTVNPTTAAVLSVVTPIFVIIGSLFINDINGMVETISINQIIGCTIMILAILMYSYYSYKISTAYERELLINE